MSKGLTITLILTVTLIVMGGGTFLVIRQVLGSQEAEKPEAEPYTVAGDTIAAGPESIKTAALEPYYEVTNEQEPSWLVLSGRTDLDQERVTHVHAQFPGKVELVGTADKPLQLGDSVVGLASLRWWMPFPHADTLCTIQSTDLANAKAAYLQADVQLQLDIKNRERTEILMGKNILAKKYLEDAESAVTKDTAVLDAARQQLLIFGLTNDDIKNISSQQGKERMTYRLISPRSGMIVEKGVVGGELADPTLNLFTVADTSTLWVWGDVYERDRSSVAEGQNMDVTLTSDPKRVYHCTVTWISPVIDATTRAIKIRGELPNPDGHLLAQMYATLRVQINKGKGLLVPADAVVRKGPQAYVFVVADKNADGKTTWRRTPVDVEPISAGPGLESIPVATHNALNRAGDKTRGAGALLRVTKGAVKPTDKIVQSGALGLFNEMEQNQNQTTAK